MIELHPDCLMFQMSDSEAIPCCAELVTAAFRSSFFNARNGTAIASVRAGNVIGGGDWGADRLVPDLMRAALSGVPIRIRNLRAVRPWQHVLNPLSGYLVLAQHLWDGQEYADAWNFGRFCFSRFGISRRFMRISRSSLSRRFTAMRSARRPIRSV